MADANKLIQDNTKKVEANAKAWAKLEDPLKKATEATKQAVEVQKQLNDQLKNAKTAKEFATAQKQIEGNIKAVSLAEKEAIEVQKKAQQLERERIRTASAHAKEKARVAKATANLNSLYKQESARLTELRNKAKDMAINLIRLTDKFGKNSVEVKKATAAFREAQTGVNKLDAQLKRVDSSLGQNQRFVGQYQNGISRLGGSLRSLAGAFGFAGGIQLFANAMRNVVKISKDYEKSNATLAAVLGKTREETIALQKESKRLGGSTAFSASEVTELQTSLARLGKTENEIIGMTEGVINASIALGSGAEETAELVGSTMNAFKLGAEESGRVADVLTLSTQRSALSFEKLSTALPIVAGAAGAVGVSLEKLVAQLGQAADRGVDASSMATGLRNIYIQLKDKGLTYNEAMRKINQSQDKLTTSVGLFGVKASVLGVALADTTTNAEDMESALLKASDGIGVAATVAAEMSNTLDGALKEQSAAWEALVLSISDADTAIGGFFRTATTAGTNVLKRIKRMNTSLEELAETKADEFMKNMVASINGLGEGVNDTELVRNNLVAWMRVYGDAAEETAKELDDLGGKAGVLDEIGLALGGSADLVAQKNLLTDMAEGYGIAADKIEELLRNDEAFAQFISRIREESKSVDENTEAKKEAKDIETDLVKLKQAEIKAAQDVTATTRLEVAARTSKVEKLKEELAALQALGKEKKLESAGVELIDIDSEVKAAKDAADERIRINFEANQKIKEDNEQAAEERKALINQGKELAIDTAASILANSVATNAQRVDDAIAKNREELNTRLADESLNEDQRAVLKAEADKREAALKLKRAKAERKDTLYRIGINTAAAVVKTLATLGIPAGIIPAAAAAAAGLAEAAVVSSKPLPKFDKGTTNAPTGGFWAGEKRPEFMVNDGKVSFIDKPTMFGNDYAGSTIIGGAETASILDNISRNEAINNIDGHNKQLAAQMLDLAMLKLETRNQTKAIVGAINNNNSQPSALDRMRERNYNNGINKHRE